MKQHTKTTSKLHDLINFTWHWPSEGWWVAKTFFFSLHLSLTRSKFQIWILLIQTSLKVSIKTNKQKPSKLHNVMNFTWHWPSEGWWVAKAFFFSLHLSLTWANLASRHWKKAGFYAPPTRKLLNPRAQNICIFSAMPRFFLSHRHTIYYNFPNTKYCTVGSTNTRLV